MEGKKERTADGRKEVYEGRTEKRQEGW